MGWTHFRLVQPWKVCSCPPDCNSFAALAFFWCICAICVVDCLGKWHCATQFMFRILHISCRISPLFKIAVQVWKLLPQLFSWWWWWHNWHKLPLFESADTHLRVRMRKSLNGAALPPFMQSTGGNACPMDRALFEEAGSEGNALVVDVEADPPGREGGVQAGLYGKA